MTMGGGDQGGGGGGGGERNGRVNNKLSLKGMYSGPLLDGMPSGPDGTCRYEDGSEYSGAWKAGKKNGMGTYLYANMDEYYGKWVGDKRCGQGRLESVLHSSYQGNWDNNLPHGTGILYFKDGTCYVGDMVRGKRHGHGKVVYADAMDTVLNEGEWQQRLPRAPPGVVAPLLLNFNLKIEFLKLKNVPTVPKL